MAKVAVVLAKFQKGVAGRGDAAQGETLARMAVDMASQSEAPMLLADAHAELAEVLAIAGKLEAARAEMARAIDLYRAKENLVSLQRSEVWLATR